MKKIIVMLSVLAFGCKKNDNGIQSRPAPKPVVEKDTAAKPTEIKKTAPLQEKKGDTLIYTAEGDTLRYKKKDFPEVYKRFEKLGECGFIFNPDIIFHGDKNLGDYDCETGQDEYYTLYAHYLQGVNGIKQNAHERNRLSRLYRCINELFGRLQYGGTYFGHQYSRIAGYVEYDIYVHLINKQYQTNEQTYPITKQKNLYIASLRQLIADESTIDFESMGDEKIKHTKKLNAIVDEISRLITDKYYLERTQEFHYSHY